MHSVGHNPSLGTRVKLNTGDLRTMLRNNGVQNSSEVVKGASEMFDMLNRQMDGWYGTIEMINDEFTFYGGVKKMQEKLPGLKNTELESWFEKSNDGFKLNLSNYSPLHEHEGLQNHVKVSVPITTAELVEKEGVDMWQPIRKLVIDYCNQAVRKLFQH